MAASLNDQFLLSSDPGFQGRVRTAMLVQATNVMFEAFTVAFHRERQTFAVQVLNSPDTYKELFANTVANDANIIADATVGGTVVLTPSNLVAQAALVTDAHIQSAATGQWNNFFRTPGS